MNYKLQTLSVRLICNPQDADFQAKLLQTLYASVCCLLSKIRVLPIIQGQARTSRWWCIGNPCVRRVCIQGRVIGMALPSNPVVLIDFTKIQTTTGVCNIPYKIPTFFPSLLYNKSLAERQPAKFPDRTAHKGFMLCSLFQAPNTIDFVRLHPKWKS
jgi:hypothetical protein